MHLAGARRADHLDDLAAGGAPHNRVVHQDDPLVLQHRPVRRVLQLHSEVADVVGGLDEGSTDIVIADDTDLERDTAFRRVAHRGWNAGIRHRHDDISRHAALTRQFRADALARVIDRRALHHRVRTRKVNVFEDAKPFAGAAKWLDAAHTLVVDDHDLAGLYITHKGSADDVERTRLARQHPTPGAL